MAAPDSLVLDTSELAPLTDPVLLVALTGLFDVAGVATSALEHIATTDVAGRDRSLIVGEIDPDPFYDFTVERPTVEIVGREDGETGTGDQLAGEHPARRPHGRRSRHRGVERCRTAPPVDDVRALHHGGRSRSSA